MRDAGWGYAMSYRDLEIWKLARQVDSRDIPNPKSQIGHLAS
jgi:hypothetical protein